MLRLWIFDRNNTTGATSGAGIDYLFDASELIPAFSGVRVARSLGFTLVVCRSLFVCCPFPSLDIGAAVVVIVW